VKGWAIRNAAAIVAQSGAHDFYVEAGGDIQSLGLNADGKPWSVGIRNPFNAAEIIKIVYPRGRGIATSGTYVRGQHIYDPHHRERPIEDIVSLTVLGPDVLEADRFATAAFAMGRAGIHFIEETPGLEGYLVDCNRRATLTSGFEACCTP
jgi:FAD:protein FMN transferase